MALLLWHIMKYNIQLKLRTSVRSSLVSHRVAVHLLGAFAEARLKMACCLTMLFIVILFLCVDRDLHAIVWSLAGPRKVLGLSWGREMLGNPAPPVSCLIVKTNMHTCTTVYERGV